MHCTNCGVENQSNATFCGRCGSRLTAVPPTTPSSPRPDVPTYLGQAILVTLFCCVPFGIVAIVKAAGVSGKLGAGDFTGAVAASNSAKNWCWASFACGLGVIALWIIMAAASEL